MLSLQEREYLARLDDLPPRTRGNMLYRIRQKVTAALEETIDIIWALDAMPRSRLATHWTISTLPRCSHYQRRWSRSLDTRP